jgi:carboxyl-terminal processing protease
VFSRIKTDYVEPVEDKKLLEDAVQGMLAGLDPHSAYLDAESFRTCAETEGQFGGLGIEVTMENGFVKVVSPIEWTRRRARRREARRSHHPARRQGRKRHDTDEAVRVMRGKPGSDITPTIVREGDKPLKITLTRGHQDPERKEPDAGDGLWLCAHHPTQAGTDKVWRKQSKNWKRK